MCFNHNSNLLLTGAVDGMIRLFGTYYAATQLHRQSLLALSLCGGGGGGADVFQQECLCAWQAHCGEVFNVQFSSDETAVYSMGSDNTFCQWSINQSGAKVRQCVPVLSSSNPLLRSLVLQVAEFPVGESACNPARGWSQQPGTQYYPSTPRGNLFAFESEDRFVLTCAQQQAVIYSVTWWKLALLKLLSVLNGLFCRCTRRVS